MNWKAVFKYIILILLAFYFSKKTPVLPGLVGNLKKNPIFQMWLVFSYYLKVDLYGSLSGQVADDKKPKISRMKAKIIYFEASNYGKKNQKSFFGKIFNFRTWITHYRNISGWNNSWQLVKTNQKLRITNQKNNWKSHANLMEWWPSG